MKKPLFKNLILILSGTLPHTYREKELVKTYSLAIYSGDVRLIKNVKFSPGLSNVKVLAELWRVSTQLETLSQ
jgi:hypothetical protein